jgi:dCTP deaminase
MILTGAEIARQVGCGRISIRPFDHCRCTTNSYDLRLGRRLLRYSDEVLDPRRQPNYGLREMPDDGVVLGRGDFVLGETAERIGSDHFVPLVHGRSGTARLGLFVHVTADLVDIGFVGNLTLQLYATLPLRIWPGMVVAQATFWVPVGEIRLYQGKYQSADGPQPSRTYLDYQKADG